MSDPNVPQQGDAPKEEELPIIPDPRVGPDNSENPPKK